MREIRILCVIIATLSNLAFGETLTVDPKRTIRIVQEINAKTIGVANRLLDITDKDNTKPVYIVINSWGGQVIAGMQVLTVLRLIRARGVEIHCVVPMMAASMAFQILAECDYRYGFEYSLFLWHPIRAHIRNKAMTPRDAVNLAADMRRYERNMVDVLLRTLQMEKKVFYKHYYNETMHIGAGLKKLAPEFIRIIDDVRGIKLPFSMY